jgi:soluble lytic murein transglycosylase
VRFLLRFLVFLIALQLAPWQADAALSEADRKIYSEAFRQAEKKDYDGARKTAARGGEALLGEFFEWLELTRDKDDGDFAESSAFLDANPHWPRLGTIRRRAEESLPKDLHTAQLVAWFGERSPKTVEVALLLVEALRAEGQEAAAIRLLRETWTTSRFSADEERDFRTRYLGLLSRDDEMARLETLLRLRSVAAARRQAKRLGAGYPELAEARLKLALDRPGVDGAIGRVPAGLKNDPGLLYERARWRQRRGRVEGVIELIDQAGPVIRRPERWWALRHWAARRAFAEGDFAASYRLASGHDLKQGAGFADGEWLAGWIALRHLNDPKRAYAHFARLHGGVGTPISLARGAYWAGEAATALGDTQTAAQWYQRAARHATAFYGQLANARLGQPLELDLANPPAPSAEAKAAFEERELVRLVRLLGAFDQRKHQKTFFTHLRRQADSNLDHHLLAELAVSLGRPDQALLTAKQARRNGALMAAHLFPLPADLGAKVTAVSAPEPALVLALIRQESAFDPQAVSRAGARGLMQLMPATAHKVARTINAKYSKSMLTEDPALNLRLGRAYLDELLQDYSGTNILALAAYNAGPRRVRSWIKEFGDPRDPDVDPVDWVESIPFNETRNYVQRVMEGLVVYRLALTGQRTVMPLDLAANEVGAAQ